MEKQKKIYEEAEENISKILIFLGAQQKNKTAQNNKKYMIAALVIDPPPNTMAKMGSSPSDLAPKVF